MPSILLMNPNASRETTEAMVAIARRETADVTGWTAISGPPLIASEEALDGAARLVAEAEIPVGIDGVIVAAFGDPGRDDLARKLKLPVVGIGQAACLAAARGGRRFAVATHTPLLVSRIDALMRSSAPCGAFLGTFLARGDPLELGRDPDALDGALETAIRQAVDAGAEAVIIGGGPLAEAARRLSGKVACDLVEPIPEAVRMVLTSIAAPASPSSGERA